MMDAIATIIQATTGKAPTKAQKGKVTKTLEMVDARFSLRERNAARSYLSHLAQELAPKSED